MGHPGRRRRETGEVIRKLPRRWIAALASLLAACAAPGRAPAPGSACPETAPDSRAWTTYDEGDFTVRIPPGFVRQESQGLDSRVGLWKADSAFISYDYGYYSNALAESDVAYFPEMVVCRVAEGRTPRVVVFRTPEGEFALGAHWPALYEDGMGTVSLTLLGAAADPGQRARLLAVVRSVSIRRR
jgi:hypothetical protein